MPKPNHVKVLGDIIEAEKCDLERSKISEGGWNMKVACRQRKHLCLAELSILLITVALLAGMMGCDSASDYLEIRNWHDLYAIRDNLGGHYLLMNDLDSTTAGYGELGGNTANQGKGWQPIGTSDNPFTGTFNGQSYGISDMFVNRPDESAVGLFAAVDVGGLIQNVRVLNANMAGDWAVGGLVGENWGDVRNSYSGGTVTGADCVGGLVGGNAGGVSNSYSAASVTGHWDVGGLVGCSDSRGSVTGSYSVGSVTGEWAVGGLVGGNLGGTVARSYSTGSVTGDDYVGGLVGDNQGSVSNSYSASSVTGEWYVGGLVGDNDYTGIVSDSYASGGVIGYSFAGGLVGSNWGAVSNSFWNIETSGMTESDGGAGRTTVAMQDIATFTDTTTEGLDSQWDITAVALGETNDTFAWNIVTDQTYPFLSWQPAS
jgi:hypothetical protein